jgi:hypothetical protein
VDHVDHVCGPRWWAPVVASIGSISLPHCTVKRCRMHLVHCCFVTALRQGRLGAGHCAVSRHLYAGDAACFGLHIAVLVGPYAPRHRRCPAMSSGHRGVIAKLPSGLCSDSNASGAA